MSGKTRNWGRYSGVLMVSIGAILLIGTATASAGPIQDIPEALGDAIGLSSTAAGYILSAAALTSVGLAMAVNGKKANMVATTVVLIAVCVCLVVIGWLDYWVMFIIAMYVAGQFAGTLKTALTGG